MEGKERVKEIIQESLASHRVWINFYDKHPEKEGKYDNTAGNRKHHEYCIAKYVEALKILNRL